MDNTLILVVGHGRSGTSLFTTILKKLGCRVPQPEVEPDSTNPRGFAESRWVVDFHTSLLKRANVHPADARPIASSKTEQVGARPKAVAALTDWLRREREHGQHVVIKDPRVLWFLPLWNAVAAELSYDIRYATMLRAPQEVLRSRAAAYGASRPQSSIAMAWINSMLVTERATRGHVRSFTRFVDLLVDWERAVGEVCQALGLNLLDRASEQQRDEIRRLVDPSLRRSSGGWEGLDVVPEVARLADETWESLNTLAATHMVADEAVSSSLDDLHGRYERLYGFAECVAESSVSAARRAGVRAAKSESTTDRSAKPKRSANIATEAESVSRDRRRKGRRPRFRRSDV